MSIEALSMVMNHSKAAGSAKLVLLGIANHLGPDAHEGAWPSQRRLADYANMSERGVQKCVDKLVALGELSVQVASGHSRSQYKPNLYWVTVKCSDDCDRSMGHRRVEPQYGQGRTPVPSGANPSTDRVEPQFVLTVIEPEVKPSENLNQEIVSHTGELFDKFWATYPNSNDKPRARREFDKAIKRVGFDTILAGAVKYRDDPNRSAEYTKHPSTWLHNDSWDNPLLPAPAVKGRKLTNAEEGALLAQRERGLEQAALEQGDTAAGKQLEADVTNMFRSI
jgi:hypothetical protein